MADDAPGRVDRDDDDGGSVAELIRAQADAVREIFAPLAAATLPAPLVEPEEALRWAGVAQRMQALWTEYGVEQAAKAAQKAAQPAKTFTDFGNLAGIAEGWLRQMPFADPNRQKALLEESLAVWENVLGQFGIGPRKADGSAPPPPLPRSDPRFADPQWREQPWFALLHQGYLMFAEQVTAMADAIEGLEPTKKEQLRFTTRAIVDALSPANFPLTNPVALERARETRGESLVKGMEHLLSDLRRGQLTHTPSEAFKLGETIATTPGKVIHQTPLYQIIQYTPTTADVLATPLVIFPPWINRFYILDLNAKKSFVRWAIEQGISVFIVSWKSADASLADIVWDDYIAAQIEVIDFVRARLDAPAAHTVGYCVAGTTLAATLAVLARQGRAEAVASATFFTAQVDFEHAGDLKHFIDDQSVEALSQLSPNGFVDGRLLAATFNLLRGNDLIWNYVRKHYLLGEDYPAFDLLYWNGDVTNLPARWHQDYLRELYRDNRLVVPDSLAVRGVPIDLRRIETPCYIQAGKEDHIAPPASVWKLTRYLKGPWTFVLAGSGHIAGVVNPPAAGKYQYWLNDDGPESLEAFVAGASEHPGSWWPHWAGWLRALAPEEAPATGKRAPGGADDPVLEDAPGRYVAAR